MMPEGPEVRTVVDQLQGGVGLRFQGVEFLSGRYTRHGPPVGYQEFMTTLSNSTDSNVDLITKWNAKGKFIYIVLDDGDQSSSGRTESDNDGDDFQRSIWITLGMSGRFVNEANQHENPHYARWFFRLLDSKNGKVRRIYYHDERNFGTLKFSLSKQELADKLKKELGPDILDPTTTEDVFVELVAAQKPETNVCKFLMNQKVTRYGGCSLD
jgi:formamidopyrimidine-DNA glycosylase